MPSPPHPERQKEEVGRRLRALREALDLEGATFAASIGVAKNTYSHWETGRNLPDIYAMGRVWDQYGVDLNYIFLGRTGTLPADLRVKVAEALNELADYTTSDLAERQSARDAAPTKRGHGRPRKTITAS